MKVLSATTVLPCIILISTKKWSNKGILEREFGSFFFLLVKGLALKNNPQNEIAQYEIIEFEASKYCLELKTLLSDPLDENEEIK